MRASAPPGPAWRRISGLDGGRPRPRGNALIAIVLGGLVFLAILGWIVWAAATGKQRAAQPAGAAGTRATGPKSSTATSGTSDGWTP